MTGEGSLFFYTYEYIHFYESLIDRSGRDADNRTLTIILILLPNILIISTSVILIYLLDRVKPPEQNVG